MGRTASVEDVEHRDLVAGSPEVGEAALAAGRRLAAASFPRDEPARSRLLGRCVVTGSVLAAALAVLAQSLVELGASPHAVGVTLAGWLAVVLGLVAVPSVFAAVGKARQRARRRRAGRHLEDMFSRAAAGMGVDPELQAFSATLVTAPFAHVAGVVRGMPGGAEVWGEAGPVGALAWSASIEPPARRPEDPQLVLGVARVAEHDPAFPFVQNLVGGGGCPFERSWRAALSCVRAAELGLSPDEVATLAAGWEGDVDGFDEALRLVAVPPEPTGRRP